MFDELVRQKIELAPPKGRSDLRGSENPDLYTSLVSDDVVKLHRTLRVSNEGRRKKEKKKKHPFRFSTAFSVCIPSSSREISSRFQEIYFHSRIEIKSCTLSSFFPPSPLPLSLNRTRTERSRSNVIETHLRIFTRNCS